MWVLPSSQYFHYCLFSEPVPFSPAGTISMPSEMFADDSDSAWLIQVPAGELIEVNFLTFNISLRAPYPPLPIEWFKIDGCRQRGVRG